MKVYELLALGGPAPPAPASPPAREALDEITRIYYDVYVPGLGAFFETTWYNFKPQGQGPNPVATLRNNTAVVNLLSAFLTSLSSIQPTGAAEMAAAGILETRVVWALACLAYTTPAAINPPSEDVTAPDDAVEARNRVAVFETLLSGGSLARNPCVPPPKSGDARRLRELEFWWWMGEYLRLQDAATTTTLAAERGQALAKMRSLLDGRENRDMLYSLAILRELSPSFGRGYDPDPPQHLDEADAKSKLAVAAKFVRGEARNGGGTTNVVRRLAELGTTAFITAEIDVARPT